MATKKSDKPQIDFNLDKLDTPESFREHEFVFRGERFTTLDPSDIPYTDLAEAYESNDSRIIIDLFLGEQAEKFWEKKPSILHVKGFADAIAPVFDAIFGGADSGESADS